MKDYWERQAREARRRALFYRLGAPILTLALLVVLGMVARI